MPGIFGLLFDLNHNGQLEPTEQAMEFTLLQQLTEDGDEELSTEDFDFEDD